MVHSQTPRQGEMGRYGSCSTEYVRGREAVMPEVQLELNLAECEDLCSLPEEKLDGK